MSGARLIVLLAALAAAGCGNDFETPTSASSDDPTTVLFSGTLQPRATRFYSYTMASAGTVTAMLASLEVAGAPVSHSLELGLGIPAGTGCMVQHAATFGTSLTPQLRQDFAVGTYCVRISDTTGLPEPTAFTIRVVHP